MSDFSEFAELERSGWSDTELAHTYAGLFSRASDLAIPAMLSALRPGSRVLDLCCGHGNISEALLKDGHAVTGLDFSDTMLMLARARIPGGDFQKGDAQNLPFEDNSFDAVICGFGLMHVPDQPAALAEIARVLHPGGEFVMSCWLGPDRSDAFRLYFSNVMTHGSPEIALPPSPDFFQFTDPETTADLFETAGLVLRKSEQVASFFFSDTPEQIVEVFAKGAPRAGYLFRSQPKDRQNAIRTAIVEAVTDNYREGVHFKVPAPSLVHVAEAL
ncbi:MAG: methyltransferase domain-containing protein [Dinoroseobacter sp.]|nr:methyltransferase domain-containing protein [Dinoroseobacter sp.]